MKIPGLVPSLMAATLAACIVPPSMMERASWSAPPDYWQSQGRYRQGPEQAPAAAPALTTPAPAPGASADQVASRHNALSTDPATENLKRAEPTPAPVEEPLYGWDGGVVDGAPQGQVQSQGGAPRGLETPGGRTHIIELYQQVLDERDALTEEVQLLRDTLQRTSTALEAESQRAAELEARVAALEEAQRKLVEDNQSIAARLVTAQIRRLESEKLLLETRIAVEQEKMAEAEQAAARQRPAGVPARGKSEEPH